MPEEKVSGSIFTVVVALAGLVGFILGILYQKSRKTTAMTEFTRDEVGRIMSIMEREV